MEKILMLLKKLNREINILGGITYNLEMRVSTKNFEDFYQITKTEVGGVNPNTTPACHKLIINHDPNLD